MAKKAKRRRYSRGTAEGRKERDAPLQARYNSQELVRAAKAER